MNRPWSKEFLSKISFLLSANLACLVLVKIHMSKNGFEAIVNVSAPLRCMLNAKKLNYKTNNDKLALMGEHCLALG